MSLYSNIDSAATAPKGHIAGGLGISANGQDLYANTTQDAFKTGMAVGVFGVSADEAAALSGNLGSVTIITAGDSFTAVPTVTITGANTTAATVTANGTVVSATIATGQAGQNYQPGDVLFFANGTNTINTTITVATVNALATNAVTSITLTRGGEYSVLPGSLVLLNAQANTSAAGTGFKANLVFGMGGTVTITNAGEGYSKSTIGYVVGGAGGANTTLALALTGQEGPKMGGAGWVLRKEGSGGRAGRVQYETLVAMGSMSTGGTDNTVVAP